MTGVDLDEEPLRLARENANLNHARIRFVQDDAFAYMREMLRQGRQYDVVVLDPPKLVRTRTELAEGTRKHFDLNRLAMRLVRPGGLMLSCCCSGLLPEAEFLQLLRAAAAQSGRRLSGRPRRHLHPPRRPHCANPRPQRRRRRSPGFGQRAGDRISQRPPGCGWSNR